MICKNRLKAVTIQLYTVFCELDILASVSHSYLIDIMSVQSLKRLTRLKTFLFLKRFKSSLTNKRAQCELKTKHISSSICMFKRWSVFYLILPVSMCQWPVQRTNQLKRKQTGTVQGEMNRYKFIARSELEPGTFI